MGRFLYDSFSIGLANDNFHFDKGHQTFDRFRARFHISWGFFQDLFSVGKRLDTRLDTDWCLPKDGLGFV